jgi:hypothetical protein
MWSNSTPLPPPLSYILYSWYGIPTLQVDDPDDQSNNEYIFKQFVKLRSLLLWGNKINGPIPEGFGQLSALETLQCTMLVSFTLKSHHFALENVIGSHACWVEASMCVCDPIPNVSGVPPLSLSLTVITKHSTATTL